MTHKICDVCETVAHCTKHGCVPLQPAQQEPVAWAFLNGQYAHLVWGKQRPDDEIHTTPLYTSPPPQRKPLTDRELYKVFPAIATYTEANKTLYRSIARAIEAAHGIKE